MKKKKNVMKKTMAQVLWLLAMKMVTVKSMGGNIEIGYGEVVNFMASHSALNLLAKSKTKHKHYPTQCCTAMRRVFSSEAFLK